MGFRLDRLNEALAVKKWEPADLHKATGIPYDQLSRLGQLKKGPTGEIIAKMVIALELDANYLLETDDRYEGMECHRAVAHMALARYILRCSKRGEPVTSDHQDTLRRLADELDEPHLWASDWKKAHASLAIVHQDENPLPQGQPSRRSRLRRGRLTS
jgi:hypothetical protein